MEAKIEEELAAIRKDIDYIKEHMIDVDSILTKNEEKILEESMKEFEAGKTVSLKNFSRK